MGAKVDDGRRRADVKPWLDAQKVSINLLRNPMQRLGSLKIPPYASVAFPRLGSRSRRLMLTF